MPLVSMLNDYGSVVGSSYVFSLLVSNFMLNGRLLWSDERTEFDPVYNPMLILRSTVFYFRRN